LAAELREKYKDANVTLIPSGKGRFEVVLDGVPIFEKSKLDRHAKPGEIVTLIEENRTTG
jgi:hypothetical protein